MKEILSDYDHGRLDKRIAEVEKLTNAQIVLAVIKRSDSYAELPWKAFALGASIAGLLIFIIDLTISYWISHVVMLIAVAAMLSAGAFFAILSVFVSSFSRLFLSAYRAETEVRQYAESLFLNKELFATTKRTGILILVSLFEKQIIILPDKGLNAGLNKDDMQKIISKMTMPLKQNDITRAMEVGLEQLSEALGKSDTGKSGVASKNELSNDIIEEKGV